MVFFSQIFDRILATVSWIESYSVCDLGISSSWLSVYITRELTGWYDNKTNTRTTNHKYILKKIMCLCVWRRNDLITVAKRFSIKQMSVRNKWILFDRIWKTKFYNALICHQRKWTKTNYDWTEWKGHISSFNWKKKKSELPGYYNYVIYSE